MKCVNKCFILPVIILLSLVVFCSGCGRTQKEQTEEVLAHMYEKYGVEFQIDWESQTVTGSCDSYNLSLKGNTDEALRGKVQVEYWFDSENPWRDNYFLVLAQSVVQERVKNAIGDAFLYKMEIRTNLDAVDNKYCSVEQFDEYLTERGEKISGHSLNLLVQDQGSEEANIRFEQEVKELLRNADIGNLFLVFVCFNEEDWAEVKTSDPLYSLTDVYTYRTNKDLFDE